MNVISLRHKGRPEMFVLYSRGLVCKIKKCYLVHKISTSARQNPNNIICQAPSDGPSWTSNAPLIFAYSSESRKLYRGSRKQNGARRSVSAVGRSAGSLDTSISILSSSLYAGANLHCKAVIHETDSSWTDCSRNVIRDRGRLI